MREEPVIGDYYFRRAEKTTMAYILDRDVKIQFLISKAKKLAFNDDATYILSVMVPTENKWHT